MDLCKLLPDTRTVMTHSVTFMIGFLVGRSALPRRLCSRKL